MLKINKLTNREIYKLNNAIQTVQKAAVTPDSVSPTDFYIAYGKVQKTFYNSEYKNFIKKYNPLFDEYKSKYNKEGITCVFEKIVESNEFINGFIEAIKTRKSKHIQNVIIPINLTDPPS